MDRRIYEIERLCATLQPKVVVKCLAYNQGRYIQDTLESFVNQKTDFNYVVIVHDDASTDNTKDIISRYAEKYPNLILPVFEEENQWSKHDDSLFRIVNRALLATGAPYVALCEGDDYWIDDNKLRKQVEFMDSHPKCMICFHAVKEIYEKSPSKNKVRAAVEPREYSGIEWYATRPSQTSSYFFRSEILNTKEIGEIYSKDSKFLAKDVPLLLSCAACGELWGLEDVMSVYRHNSGGWTAKERTDEETIKIIDSQLAYGIFGEDFKIQSRKFYQRECVQAFYANLKRRKLKMKYLAMSLKISVGGTLAQLYKVVNQHIHSQYKG